MGIHVKSVPEYLDVSIWELEMLLEVKQKIFQDFIRVAQLNFILIKIPVRGKPTGLATNVSMPIPVCWKYPQIIRILSYVFLRITLKDP